VFLLVLAVMLPQLAMVPAWTYFLKKQNINKVFACVNSSHFLGALLFCIWLEVLSLDDTTGILLYVTVLSLASSAQTMGVLLLRDGLLTRTANIGKNAGVRLSLLGLLYPPTCPQVPSELSWC